MDSLGPLSLMYSWQALLCATACVGVTQLVKTVIEMVYASKLKSPPGEKGDGPYRTAAKEKRKDNLWITRLLLPMTPIFVGAVYAMLVPLRPEVLVNYVADHVDGTTMQIVAFGAWGAACGQFAIALHDKLKDILKQSSPA